MMVIKLELDSDGSKSGGSAVDSIIGEHSVLSGRSSTYGGADENLNDTNRQNHKC